MLSSMNTVAEAGIKPTVGKSGDKYDNAKAETIVTVR